MSIIRTENLSRTYRPDTVPVQALNGVSLSFEKGEFTTVKGPSGSGKTTLLNLIGGLDKPTEGSVQIEGQTITDLPERTLIRFRLNHIGFVFQSYNLVPVFTAEENVAFIMQLQGRSKSEIRDRVVELMEAVGLEDKLDARPKELSGGEQQRVAVARALAPNPKFILADEPTANLDTSSAMNLLDIMETMNREQNITFIFSSHDHRVIDRARRVINLVDGEVESDSSGS